MSSISDVDLNHKSRYESTSNIQHSISVSFPMNKCGTLAREQSCWKCSVCPPPPNRTLSGPGDWEYTNVAICLIKSFLYSMPNAEKVRPIGYHQQSLSFYNYSKYNGLKTGLYYRDPSYLILFILFPIVSVLGSCLNELFNCCQQGKLA